MSFIVYSIESFTGLSPGSIICNLRVGRIKESNSVKDLQGFKNNLLRGFFLSLPIFPIIDNMFSYNNIKYTDRKLGFIVLEKIKSRRKCFKMDSGVNKYRYNKLIKKYSHRIISKEDINSYYALLSKLNIDSQDFILNPSNTTNRIYKIKDANTLKHIININNLISSGNYLILTKENTKESNKYCKELTIIEGDSWKTIFYISLFLFYIPLLIQILIIYFTKIPTVLTPAPYKYNYIHISFTQMEALQSSFLSHNFSLDYKFFILGGITMFFLPFLEIYSEAFLSGSPIGGTFRSHYNNFFIFGVLPQLIPETMGYVFGIMSGLYITRIIMGSINDYIKGKNIDLFYKHLFKNLIYIVTFFAVSLLLLVIASYVEAFITPLLLDHYYYIILA
ncbi:stage II sporulation protein M [Ferroplasma sp.]|uniref:stage II sporulation protein M n=1 Tax=Ferroplasma sp. TaxID=2591003 RepID=UPI00307EB83A